MSAAIAKAATELAKKWVGESMTIPIVYEGAEVGSEAIVGALTVNRLEDEYGLTTYEAYLAVSGGLIVEVGTFAIAETALLAGLGLTEFGSLGSATPAVVTVWIGGTVGIADVSGAFGDATTEWIRNAFLSEGWQNFKTDTAGWLIKGAGIAGEFFGFSDDKQVEAVIAPTADGFDIEVAELQGFTFYETADAILKEFETGFYPVTDQVNINFNQGAYDILGVLDGTSGHTITADGILLAQAAGGNDTVLRTGDIMPVDNEEPSIIDGGAGADTIDYSAITSFTSGLEINLKEGVSTPLGASHGVPLDVLDNFEHVIGTSYADRIVGSAAADTLEGGGGNDVLWGGEGTVKASGAYTATDYGQDDLVGDSLVGGAGADTIYAGQGDTVYGDDGVAESSTDGGDVIYAYNATSVFGGGGNDTIYAYYDQTDLSGVSIDGGGGDDKIYVVCTDTPRITVELGTGHDTVMAGGHSTWLKSYEPSQPLDNQSDTYILQPGAFSTIWAFGAQSTFQLGDQSISGLIVDIDGGGNFNGSVGGGYGLGIDLNSDDATRGFLTNTGDTQIRFTLTLGPTVTEDWPNDYPTVHNPISVPSPHVDSYTQELDQLIAGYASGGSGSSGQTFEGSGSASNDTYSGGAGTDRISYVSTTQGVNVNLATGQATGSEIGTDTLTSIENARGGTGADTLTGAADANVLEGKAGNDSLQGGGGADTLYGDEGNDYAQGGDGDDYVYGWIGNDSLYGGAGADFLGGDDGSDFMKGDDGDDTLYGWNGSDTMHGDNGNDALIGEADGDSLIGGAGNDTLSGGAGTDTVIGGVGDDLYIVDDNNDLIMENVGEGVDTVQTYDASVTLASNVENLVLLGALNRNGAGNALNNTLTGNSGNNAFWGNDGNDSMLGNDGNDSLFGGNGNDDLLGGNGDDLVKGEAGNDSLTAGAGNDTLEGNSGADTLIGGTGNDLYIVDDNNDTIIENSGEGVDTVQTSGSSLTLASNVENLLLLGALDRNGAGNALNNVLTGNSGNNAFWGQDGNDTIFGNNGNDSLHGENGNDSIVGGDGNDSVTGGAGNDTLEGNVGSDTLIGGAGNDLYIVDDNNDTIIENTGEGIDTVQTAGSSLTLASNVENLLLTGTLDRNGGGNASNNTLTGNSGNNAFWGQDGTDTLIGNGGNDSLYGGNGNDTLTGGAGADSLAGGAGSDSFIFLSLGDSTSASRDIIADFVHGTDKISFAAIASITGMGDLTVTLNGGNTVITSGGGFEFLLTGDFTQGVNQLTASDFIF